uniref:Bcl-2-like protein n=1 Tax=Sinanodonta woodiana TaxID=1069815 RepID=A0AA96HEI7_SINWO|nr:Bcl-2-like protein [Sinanodonta woodiana]
MGCKSKAAGEGDFTLNMNCIVSDYINYRLKKAGFNWPTSPQCTLPDNEVLVTVRRICDEFEERVSKQFPDLCSSYAKIDVNADSVNKIYEETIGNELNWGRVVGILTFSGIMARQCMVSGQANKVDYLVDWTCNFISKKVEPWTREHNGWKGFVDFFSRPTKDTEQKTGWKLLTLGAIGVAALGAIFVQRT